MGARKVFSRSRALPLERIAIAIVARASSERAYPEFVCGRIGLTRNARACLTEASRATLH